MSAKYFVKKIIFFIVCGCFLPFFVFPINAMPASKANGAPPFHADKKNIYRLWRVGDVWHLRWSSKGHGHIFSGRIWVDKGRRLSLVGKIRTMVKDQVYKEGNAIRFLVKNRNDEKGFDFSWDGASIYLDLKVDGVPLLQNVLVGALGIHPGEMPFTIHRKIPPLKKRVWVPGHHNLRGRWIPGHHR